MIFRTLGNLATSENLSAQLKVFSIMKIQGRLIFYHAGIQTGLLRKLTTPSSLDMLAGELHIANRQLLSSLLDLGCSLGEISHRNGEYLLKGKMAKALAYNVPLAELVRETVQYHGDVARRLDTFLLKNTGGDYLKEFGGVIAESSRLTEPLIKAFIYHAVKKSRPLTILEIGCGSGEYLKYYVDINRNNRGIAIDKDASAAAIAQKRIKDNGIGNNFTAIQDDIMRPSTLKGESFDLVTSFSNIYYFSDDERERLFASVHRLLTDEGRFILATGMKSGSLSTSYYDLIFSATEGLYPLPRKKDIVNDLKRCGFRRIRTVKIPDRSFMGFIAYK